MTLPKGPEQLPVQTTVNLSDVLREQAVIFGQMKALDRRAPGKYRKITVVLHLLSCSGFAPAISAAYHFCRMVDDFADGDAALPANQDFPALVDMLKTQIFGAQSGDSDLEFLLKRVLLKLEESPLESVDHKAELVRFLDAMKVEHDKRLGKEIFTREELSRLYDDSFGPPHMIAFKALGSNTSGESIRDLFQLQGRLYAVRDLLPELKNGIIFIPREVVTESGLSSDQLLEHPEECLNDPVIQAWIKDEYEDGLRLIHRLREVAKGMDWKTKGLIEFLVRPIETHIKVRSVMS